MRSEPLRHANRDCGAIGSPRTVAGWADGWWRGSTTCRELSEPLGQGRPRSGYAGFRRRLARCSISSPYQALTPVERRLEPAPCSTRSLYRRGYSTPPGVQPSVGPRNRPIMRRRARSGPSRRSRRSDLAPGPLGAFVDHGLASRFRATSSRESMWKNQLRTPSSKARGRGPSPTRRGDDHGHRRVFRAHPEG
jgi:hypothetical protein